MQDAHKSCSYFTFETNKFPAVRFPGKKRCWVSALPAHLLGLERGELLSRLHEKGAFTCACSENPVRALLLGYCLSWGVFWFRLTSECEHCQSPKTPKPEPTSIEDVVLTGCVLQQESIKDRVPVNGRTDRFSGWSPSSLCLYGGVIWEYRTKIYKNNKERISSIWSLQSRREIWGLVTNVGHSSTVCTNAEIIRVVPLACIMVLCAQNPFSTSMEPRPILGPRIDFENGGDWEKVRFILLPAARNSSHAACILTTKLEFLPAISLSKSSQKILANNSAGAWELLKKKVTACNQSRLDFAWNIQKIRISAVVSSMDSVDLIPVPSRRRAGNTKLPPLVLCATPLYLDPPTWQEQSIHLNLEKLTATHGAAVASLKESMGLGPARKAILLQKCEGDLFLSASAKQETFQFVLTLCYQQTGFYPCCTTVLSNRDTNKTASNHHHDCYFHPTARKCVPKTESARWELRRLSVFEDKSQTQIKKTYSDLLRFPIQMVILNEEVLAPTNSTLKNLKIKQEGTLQLLFRNVKPHLACLDLMYTSKNL